MPTRTSVGTSTRVWAALLIIYVIWGSTYLGIAYAIESIPPFLMAAIRFLIAGALLVGWDLARSGRVALPTWRELRDSAVVGALLLGIGNGFVAFGEQTVPSGIAAILIAMVPVWLSVFGWVYVRDRLPRLVVLGVAIGLLGVVLLVWPFGGGAPLDLLGIGVLLVAPIGWAHGSLFAARLARLPRHALTASGLQMLAGAALLFVESLVTGEPARFQPGSVTLTSVLGVAYLVVFGSMVAFSTYAWLLRSAPLSLVGTYAFINPVVAIFLGAVFLSESIGPRELLASAVIVVAVAMIVFGRSRASRLEAAEGAEGLDEALIDARRAEEAA